MKRVEFKNPSNNLTIVGNLFFPENFDESKAYPAVVVGHPAGGVKEQTSGVYARRLAEENGYVTLAYDATYQGESEGTPRGFEDPTSRVSDFHAAVDYFTTLPFVDNDRIGAMGVCASGGYVIKAAQTDRRIKVVGGVSPADIGLTFRNGWFNNTPDAVNDIIANVNAQRTAEANGAEPLFVGWVPDELTGDEHPEIAAGHVYYRTEQGSMHPNSKNRFPFVNFDRVIEFSSFDEGMAKLLTQPTILVAGEEAGTRWEAEVAYELMANEKELHLVPGANHFNMYEDRAEDAIALIAPFFAARL